MPADVGVLVARGAVSLCGVVDTIAQRRAAVSAAQGVPGVSGVADELLVFLSSAAVHVDVMVAVVAQALTRDPAVATEGVRIIANDDGTIVLIGSVPSSAERAAATRVVEHLRDVRVVDNRLLLGRPAVASVARERARTAHRSADHHPMGRPARRSR